MKRFTTLILGMLFIFCSAFGQSESVSKKLPPTDSVMVNVKFEKVKFSQEEKAQNAQLSLLLDNSSKVLEQLSSSINKFTSVAEENLRLSQTTKLDIISSETGVKKEKLQKVFNRNANILFISLALFFLVALSSLIKWLQKGLEINMAFKGTLWLMLYGGILSALFYFTLTLLFNKQYFVLKDILSSMF